MAELLTKFWILTSPDGQESATAIEGESDQVLQLYEMVRGNGYTVREVDAFAYADWLAEMGEEVSL